jgi:hypothetical protein
LELQVIVIMDLIPVANVTRRVLEGSSSHYRSEID